MNSRRTFLSTTLKAAGGLLVCRADAMATNRAQAAPALIQRDAVRPGIPYGTAVGDVSGSRAIIWSKTDRPAQMIVEWATTEPDTSINVTSPAPV